MSEKELGMVIGEVKSLTVIIATLTTSNSSQHTLMFEYIEDLKKNVSRLDIEQTGNRVYAEGIGDNLKFIIEKIEDLREDIVSIKEKASGEITKIQEAILLQLQQNFMSKVLIVFTSFANFITAFAKTKAGGIILVLAFGAIIAVIVGIPNAIELIKAVKN